MCDEVVNVTYGVVTNVTNTVSTNVTSAVSINSDDENVRYKMDCYILYSFLFLTILLLIFALICYQLMKYSPKKILTRYQYNFDDIIKFEELDFDNISLDEKSYKIFSFMMFHTKL